MSLARRIKPATEVASTKLGRKSGETAVPAASKTVAANEVATTVGLSPTAVEVVTVEEQIEQHAQNVERVQRDSVIEIGRELKQAQELFRFRRDERGFSGWLAKRLPHISLRSAYAAIQRYDGIGEFAELCNLSGAAQLETATAEPDVKAIIAERVAAGEVFTAAQVKELKAKAAEEAIAKIKSDAESAKAELTDLRSQLSEKAKKASSDVSLLQQNIDALTAKLKAYEDQVAAFKKSLPKPKEAEKIASETGVATLGSDGKYHSGSSAEQKKMVEAYLFVFDKLVSLSERAPAAERVVAGCAEKDRAMLSKQCATAMAYLGSIRSIIDG